MSGIRNNSRRGIITTTEREIANKKQNSFELKNVANTVIATTNSHSGAMSFEVSNVDDNDLSLTVTVNIEMSVSGSGSNWQLATDSAGDDLTYTLAQGAVIMDAISGIPKGTNLRIVVVTAATGNLIVTTRQ